MLPREYVLCAQEPRNSEKYRYCTGQEPLNVTGAPDDEPPFNVCVCVCVNSSMVVRGARQVLLFGSYFTSNKREWKEPHKHSILPSFSLPLTFPILFLITHLGPRTDHFSPHPTLTCK